MSDKNKAFLAQELGRSIIELRSRIRQHVQKRIKKNNINISYEMLEVLVCLWRKDGINQQELADRTLKEKASMSYLIDNLVKRDLVKRSEDENDRRNKRIYLTGEGKQLQEQMQPWATEMYTAASDDLSAEIILAATQLIQKMTKNIK